MSVDESYGGPERRRRRDPSSDGWGKYEEFVLRELERIDTRLTNIERSQGEMRLKQVSFGILGAIAGALPGLVTALFMYYSLVHKGP